MLQHEHFGKLRSHKHTSYAGLFFILILGAVILAGISFAADAAVPAVNPQSGSVGLTGTVTGPAPTTSAPILSPGNGTSTSNIPITISGACPTGTFVSLERNNIFGGAVACSDAGTFSLQADLFDGVNIIYTRVTDALGQNGPNSAPITVYYNAPSLALPGGSVAKQLFLDMSTTITGGDPALPIGRTVTIVGGVGPYAVEWDWGDGNTSLASQGNEGDVSATHTYARAGTYTVIVRVTDSTGNSAFLQFVTVVNGPVAALGATTGSGLGSLSGSLVSAWPLYGLAAVMVFFFWIGERREVSILRRKNVLVNA
jgi:PKD repeat protein